jgi:hypothetical protein
MSMEYDTREKVLQVLLKVADSGNTPRLQRGGSAGTPVVCDMVPAFSYDFEGFGFVVDEWTESSWCKKQSRTQCYDLPVNSVYALIDQALASPDMSARITIECFHVLHDDDYDNVNDVTDSSSGTFREPANLDLHLSLTPKPELRVKHGSHQWV